MLISTLLRVAMVSFTIILMGNIPLPRARKILTYHNPVFLKIVKNSKKKKVFRNSFRKYLFIFPKFLYIRIKLCNSKFLNIRFIMYLKYIKYIYFLYNLHYD